MRRQIVTSVDGISGSRLEIPVVYFAQGNIFQNVFGQVFQANRLFLFLFQIHGFGQEFSARHVNAWGKRTGDEIIEGTKKFCEEHSFVDAKKIGCIGASYGGFMTQYLQRVVSGQ